MINFNRIQHAIFIGTCPGHEVDIERLEQGPGVTAILNLQTDADFGALKIDWARLETHYSRRGLTVRRWPIRDFDPDDLEHRIPGAAAALGELLSAGHQVYVHCTAGVCRAPAVVIAFLAWHRGWDLDEAYEFVKRQRPCSPYLDRIRAAGSARAG